MGEMFNRLIEKIKYLYGIGDDDSKQRNRGFDTCPFCLQAIRGPFVGQSFFLEFGQNTLGRSGCSIAIPEEDPTVSRRHAVIFNENDCWFIEDTKSTNGTFVNGQEIYQCEIWESDEIRIGDSVFILRQGDPSQKISISRLSNEGLARELAHVSSFETHEVIGRGGMATVYKGITIPENKIVAVKIPHPEFCRDESFLKRFKDEATIGMNMQHENIVEVYDYGFLENAPYILMEFVEGDKIRDLIDCSQGGLNSDEARKIGQETLAALAYAHSQQVLHRDIKPDNMRLTSNNITKVMDFGIARQLDRKTQRHTVAGAILGSPFYLAPERIEPSKFNNGNLDDPRSDIYAVGIVLYEMLTKQVPFTGKPFEVLKQHVEDTPSPPSTYRSDIDPQLERVILRALEKYPSSRYTSAEEMLMDLGGQYVSNGPVQTRLILTNELGEEYDYDISGFPEIEIGANGRDIQVDGTGVEGEHLRLLVDDGCYIIENLSKESGVCVNGERISKQSLRNNDCITFGSITFKFQMM
jgi:serine/threonine protein kinase